MKAIVIEKSDAGGALVYRDVPDPLAGPDEPARGRARLRP